MLHGDGAGFEGEFYATRGVVLEPRPVQRPGPPIWVASWGSPPGLRRVARLGDGWLASAYNTTPERFREGLDRLAEERRRLGKAPERFPSAIATAWLHVTEDTAAAERTLGEVLAPMLRRPVEALRSAPLLIGPAEVCAERLAAFVAAGARRIFVWPLGDEVRQLGCSANASPPPPTVTSRWVTTASAVAAASAGKPRKSPEARWVSQRSRTYQTRGAGRRRRGVVAARRG